jgi:uncharacterized membrane protein
VNIREKLAAKRSVEKNGFRWRAGDVTRLEQFSDAVFAFALALIVVANEVPKGGAELLATLADFPAFVATFATITWIWYYHYLYFRRYGFADAFTTFLNATLLLLLLFYVYPLRFIMGALLNGFMGKGWAFSFDQASTLMAVYSLGFASLFAMFALLYRHAYRLREELELNELELLITRGSMHANLILVGVGIVAAAMAWFGPFWLVPFAGMIYATIGPLMRWHSSRVYRAARTLTLTTTAATDASLAQT